MEKLIGNESPTRDAEALKRPVKIPAVVRNSVKCSIEQVPQPPARTSSLSILGKPIRRNCWPEKRGLIALTLDLIRNAVLFRLPMGRSAMDDVSLSALHLVRVLQLGQIVDECLDLVSNGGLRKAEVSCYVWGYLRHVDLKYPAPDRHLSRAMG
jgi:hypothetical protein